MDDAPSWLLVVMTCLATYRVTRFITTDAFPLVAGPRRWIDKHWNPFPDQDTWDSYRKAPEAAQDIVRNNLAEIGILSRPTGLKRSIAYLIGCSWCTSIWVSGGLVGGLVALGWMTWTWAVLLWLTASAVTGAIAQREPE